MIRYAPLGVCRKLHDMGCKSTSNMFWITDSGEETYHSCYVDSIPSQYRGLPTIPVYNIQDFINEDILAYMNNLAVWLKTADASLDHLDLYDQFAKKFWECISDNLK